MFDAKIAKQIVASFSALGLRVNVVPTEYNKLEPNFCNNQHKDYSDDKQKTIQEFTENKFVYTLIMDLNLSGYMTVLEELGALAQMQRVFIGKRTAFIFQILEHLLPVDLKQQLRLLMNVQFKATLVEGFDRIQRSTHQDEAHSQFLIATNDVVLKELTKNLQDIIKTKKRLELVMSAFTLKVNASAFIEHILLEKDNYGPVHKLDDYFCIEFAAHFSQPKPFSDLKKLFNAMGVYELKVIRDRMGSKNLSILLSRADYQKMLDFSPDFLGSIQDVVTQYVLARDKKRTIEAEAVYDALCHLVKANTEASNTQTTQVNVPTLPKEYGPQRHMAIYPPTADPFDQNKTARKIVTQLPTTKRYDQFRDWQTTLLGLVYDHQLAEQEQAKAKKWFSFLKSDTPDVRKFFEQIATNSFDQSVQQFEVAALASTGFVGRCLQQNHMVVRDFLQIETKVINYSNDKYPADYLKHAQEWKGILEKMREVEINLASNLTTLLLGMKSNDPSFSVYSKLIDKLYGTETKMGSITVLTKTIDAVETYFIKKKPFNIEKLRPFLNNLAASLDLIMSNEVQILSWQDLEVDYDSEALPQSADMDLQPIQQAFKEMGLGDVAIELKLDDKRNINYLIKFKKVLTVDEIEFLEAYGMEAVAFDEPQIFNHGVAPEKKRIECQDNQLTCNPNHLQGFIEQYNSYHLNAMKLHFVFEQLLQAPVQISAPIDAFKFDKVKQLVVNLKNPSDLARMSKLMQAIGITIETVDNQLVFSEDNLTTFNDRALVFQFFKPFGELTKQCLAEKDVAGAALLTSLLCHLVGKIYGADIPNLWTEVSIKGKTIKIFNADQSKIGSLSVEIKTWTEANKISIQELVGSSGSVSNFIEGLIKATDVLSLSTRIPFRLLFQRHGLLSVQLEQEKSIETLLDLYLSGALSANDLQENIDPSLRSQVEFKASVRHQVEQKIMCLSIDRILIEELERVDKRAEAVMVALNFLKKILTPGNDVAREENRQLFLKQLDGLIKNPDYAAFSSSLAVFSKVQAIFNKHYVDLSAAQVKPTAIADKEDDELDITIFPAVPTHPIGESVKPPLLGKNRNIMWAGVKKPLPPLVGQEHQSLTL